MQRSILVTILFSGLLAACGSRAAYLTIPEYELTTPPPAHGPEVAAVVPRLVRYPGLEVSYVANADGEIYFCRGVFYTFFDGNWFYAKVLRGPWRFIEMKFVPADCFRVKGQRPPGLEPAPGDQ